MNSKPIYLSKTFWFNVLTVLFAVTTFFGFTPNEGLAKQVSDTLIIASPLVNLLLRLITKKPIAL